MADTWVTDITHFLDEEGEIITRPPHARKLGDYFAAIIMMATFPDPDYPPEYRVSCRRKPHRKPCLEDIIGYIDPETDEIFWKCPKCEDRGLISNWRGTIWDMSDFDEVVH